ncbi:hypothetical protein [Salipaludibacillus daqingensis]|nr:hypothetical protein [Salipaludibacillus daqingensis]
MRFNVNQFAIVIIKQSKEEKFKRERRQQEIKRRMDKLKLEHFHY